MDINTNNIIIMEIFIFTIIALSIIEWFFFYKKIPLKSYKKYTPQKITYREDLQELLNLINLHRTNLNLSILQPEFKLTELADEHCEYMVSNNKISHDNFEKRASETFQLGFVLTAEVVGGGYKTNPGLFKAYLQSETHKRVLETPKVNYVGISKLLSKNSTDYNVIILSFY